MTFSITYYDSEIKTTYQIDSDDLTSVKKIISQERMDEALKQAADDLIQKALLELYPDGDKR